MYKVLLSATVFLLGASDIRAQSHLEQYRSYVSKSDTAGQAKVLRAWNTANPKDPELYIAWFNYYVRKSAAEVVSLNSSPQSGGYTVRDTGTGKPVAFLSSSVRYNPALLAQGFDYIDRGIALFPTRLDMRFGKIYMLGESEDFNAYTKEIVLTVEYDHSINHAWLWKEGKPLEDARGFFLGSMQSYVRKIYDQEDNSLLPLMRDISEAIVRYEPTHVESLSNIALTYLITHEYAKGLPYLLRAETVAPKDPIVLNNIAEAYKGLGDKPKAKAYYEKVIRYGDQEFAEDARRKIAAL